jgi:RecG-like helicase
LRFITKIQKLYQHKDEPYVIGNETLGDKCSFENFLAKGATEMSIEQVNLLRRFSTFLTYCATTVSFLMGNNISLSDYMRRKAARQANLVNAQHGEKNRAIVEEKIKTEPARATTFYLTVDQQQVLYSENARVILTGVPGSGKTLLLQMLALKSLRMRRLTVILCPESLMASYIQFFALNFFSKEQIKRGIGPSIFTSFQQAAAFLTILRLNERGHELEDEERTVIVATDFLNGLRKLQDGGNSWKTFISFRDYDLFWDEFGRFEVRKSYSLIAS